MTVELKEAAYFATPHLNSSLLAEFSKSRDHALMERDARHFFDQGHAFEDILWWKVYGDPSKFDKKFFVSDLGTPPDKIVKALESDEDLMELEVLTKAGARDKRYQNLHDWIDACNANPGRKPISKVEFDALGIMADHMLSMDLDGPAGDIIGACEWQVPIYWEMGGIKKKALIDLVLHVGGETYLYDIKTAANLDQFKRSLKSRYWIQDLHYTEGAIETWGDDVRNMVFLVAEKSEPWLAQPFRIAPESRDFAEIKYLELCEEFAQWDVAGRPPRGWKYIEDIKVYA